MDILFTKNGSVSLRCVYLGKFAGITLQTSPRKMKKSQSKCFEGFETSDFKGPCHFQMDICGSDYLLISQIPQFVILFPPLA